MRDASTGWKAAIVALSIVTVAWVAYLGVRWEQCDGRMHGAGLVECG